MTAEPAPLPPDSPAALAMAVRLPRLRLRLPFVVHPNVEQAIEMASRAGYVARGFVYFSVGLIALWAAFGLTPHAHGAQGALVEAWARWAPGQILLWLTGIGLLAFVGWRALQALFDVDNLGNSPKAIVARGGQAISGLIYGALAFSVFRLVDTLEDLREPDEQAATRQAVATAMHLPMGPWLVMGVGAFMLVAGVGNILQAFFRDFDRLLDCDAAVGKGVSLLGRFGYFARGVAFLPAGAFMVSAGLHARASEARGLGAVLDTIKERPFGHPVLGFLAAGLIAFGFFAFAEARFRRMRTLPDTPEPSLTFQGHG